MAVTCLSLSQRMQDLRQISPLVFGYPNGNQRCHYAGDGSSLAGASSAGTLADIVGGKVRTNDNIAGNVAIHSRYPGMEQVNMASAAGRGTGFSNLISGCIISIIGTRTYPQRR